MTDGFRYAGFISYSSKDSAFAKRLHSALEAYGIPASLGQFQLVREGKRNRIYPVFRDREEMSAGQLGALIEESLRASSALIVVCSPHGAASPWVQKEIEYFASLGRRDRVFAIIASNAPVTDGQGADTTAACFPPALRGDALLTGAVEPIAADARPGKDGFRNAWLKIVAGLINVSPGQLIDRDTQRRRAQAVRSVALALLAVIGLGVAVATEGNWRPAVYDYFKPQSRYEVVFTGRAEGLSASSYETASRGSEVFFNGIPVGHIERLRLDADDPRRVIARIAIEDSTPVRRDTTAELRLDEDSQRVILELSQGSTQSDLLEGGGPRGPAPRLSGTINSNVADWRRQRLE